MTISTTFAFEVKTNLISAKTEVTCNYNNPAVVNCFSQEEIPGHLNASNLVSYYFAYQCGENTQEFKVDASSAFTGQYAITIYNGNLQFVANIDPVKAPPKNCSTYLKMIIAN
jgi:hypothetical protein